MLVPVGRNPRLTPTLLALAAIGVFTACADSNAPDATVARVAIRETGILLPTKGATRRLSAAAYDAEDREIAAPISWRSTTPASIAIDSEGTVTAMIENGASQIFAEARGIASRPLVVAVTALPVGAVALTDAQIVGDPIATTTGDAPTVGATYEVVLTGVAAPAVGALLINTESKPVAGRVVKVVEAGGNIEVTLEIVPANMLFPDLAIRETIDLATAELEIDAELENAYDIERDGATLRFLPKSGSGLAPAQTNVRGPGPFANCKLKTNIGNQLPIRLDQPPAFSITQNFSLDVVYTSSTGLERFVAKGEIGAAYEGSLTISVAFVGEVTCEKEVAVIRVPVAGPLSWVIGGLIPISIGIQTSGKLTLASVSIGVKAEAKAKAEIGMACPHGTNCGFVGSLTGDADVEPIWKKPSGMDLRVDADFAFFGKAEIAIGNPVFPKVRIAGFEARMGPTLKGSFAPWSTQIDDTKYASSYGVSFDSKLGAGIDLMRLLERFGVDDISILELKGSIDLAKSPAGVMTADRSTFVKGDTIHFEVALDPASVEFFPAVGPYNVEEIVLVRKLGNGSLRDVGRTKASAGQKDFKLAYVAPDSGRASEFNAFIVTHLLPADALSLEVSRPPCTITDVGSLGGASEATAVNDLGQVAGWYEGGAGAHQAFFWDDGVMQSLGTLGGDGSDAFGINDDGVVVGTSLMSTGYRGAFRWQGGALQPLGTLGGSMSGAMAINDDGDIVGFAIDANQAMRAVRWNPVIADLGTLGGASVAYGVSDAGHVVGWSKVGEYPELKEHAFLWRGSMQDLGTGGWAQSTARGINDHGDVVGYLINETSDDWSAFVSRGGALQNLGGTRAVPWDINNAGVIVGESGQRAVRWKDGTLELLDSLLPTGSGWTLQRARAINERGQIVGAGSSSGGARRAFLLSCDGA